MACMCVHTSLYTGVKYHKAGKFGSDNVWQKWIYEDFGEKCLANQWISHKFINCNY